MDNSQLEESKNFEIMNISNDFSLFLFQPVFLELISQPGCISILRLVCSKRQIRIHVRHVKERIFIFLAVCPGEVQLRHVHFWQVELLSLFNQINNWKKGYWLSDFKGIKLSNLLCDYYLVFSLGCIMK